MRSGNSNAGRLRRAWLLFALVGVAVVLASCAPAASPAETAGGAPGSAPPAGPKILRMGMITSQERFVKGGIVSSLGGGTANGEYAYTFHTGLTLYDPQSALLPRVAQKVPTVQDGDWKVFPDGQMEVTWKLRPNVKWHDGTTATAGDFAFGMQVVQDREYPNSRSDAASLISELTAPDASTLVVRWKQTYVYGNVGGPTDILALPRHLMGDLYERGDKQAFFNSPLWRTEFVGLGPYRLGEWVEGSRLEGLAFDDYFLDRPKIDRVIFQFVGEPSTLIANLLGGTVDMTTIGNFQIPSLVELKKVWDPAGGGTAFAVASRTRTFSFQFRDADAPWARDVRVRRALAHMLDREALTEALMGGMVSVADTLVAPNDPVYRLLEQRGLVRQPFDLAQAGRLMAEAGWTRTPGGAYRSSAGQPFTIDISFSDSVENAAEAQAVAGQWKATGLAEATLTGIPTTAPDPVRREGRNSARGVAAFPTGADLLAIGGFRTSETGTVDNQWFGNNRGGYSNPAFDRLYDRASVTLDEGQRQGLMADMLKILADNVVMITGFYDSSLATGAFRKGIRGPGQVSGLQLVSAWNIHEWEMD